MPRLKIYKASAGSGKTFSLVREYLQLLYLQPTDFRHILGVTFTNKSTAEMKQRIITELHRLASGQPSGHREALAALSGKDDDEVNRLAKQLLKNILHDYGHLSIMTIDSFFQRLIKSFARDIGLSAGFQVEMDTGKVLDEAIDAMISDLEAPGTATRWIIKFALEKVGQGKSWNFRDELKTLGSEVFREQFQLYDKEIAALLSDEQATAAIESDLTAIVKSFENSLEETGKKGVALIRHHGMTLDDFTYKSASFASLFYKLAAGNFDVPGVRANAAANTPDNWCGKKAEAVVRDKMNAIYPELNALLCDALQVFSEKTVRYNSARNALRYFYQFVLITDLLRYISRYREENDTMLIADTAGFINKVMDGNEDAFIFEKAGSFFHHYLIDEFQDTSRLQWENFKPLISNSISQDNLSMVVGDVKQSIYRFRNGDWRLLLKDAEEEIPYSETIILDSNFRSRKNIVRFNNALFRSLPVLFRQAFEAAFETTDTDPNDIVHGLSGQFELAYAGQEQKTREDASGGLVHLEFIEEEKSSETGWKAQALQKIPERIRDLKSRGYANSEIVLLVRDARDARLVALYLTDVNSNEKDPQKQLPYITDQSLLLTSSSAVRVMVSSLHYLHDRRNDLHHANMRYELEAYVKNNDAPGNLHRYFDADPEQPPGPELSEFYAAYGALRQLPLYDLTDRLIAMLGLGKYAQGHAFLQAFQDAVMEFSSQHSTSLPAFLEWWEHTGKLRNITLSEGQDAIRILTVHKSKGLEFPAVIIPFCDWPIDHLPFHTNFLWVHSEQPSFAEMPVIPVRYRPELEKTYFRDEYASEKFAAYLDNLNLLYVALTRPVNELYIFTEKKEGGKAGRIAHLLYQSVKNTLSVEIEGAELDEGNTIFRLGEPMLHTSHRKQDDSLALRDYYASDGIRRMHVKAHTRDLYEIDPGAMLKIRYGTLVHMVLSRIMTAKDAETVLPAMVMEGYITPQEVESIRAILERLLAVPDVAAWFAEGRIVYNEQPLLAGTSGEIFIPDRVVIHDGKATVVEFKSGEKNTRYARQVKTYMSALKDMGYSEVEGFILYTATASIEKI